MLFFNQLSKQYITFLGILNMAAVAGIDFVNCALTYLNLRVTLRKSNNLGKIEQVFKMVSLFSLTSLNFMRQFLKNLGANYPL